jgi:hypothetical protein
MGSMRFMSFSRDPRVLPKSFEFDSSPGRAIGQALGAGVWDEKSYSSTLVETRGEEEVYEVEMRRKPTDSHPGEWPPEKVGMITWKRPQFGHRG